PPALPQAPAGAPPPVVTGRRGSRRCVLMMRLVGDPDRRKRAALAAILSSRQSVLRYLAHGTTHEVVRPVPLRSNWRCWPVGSKLSGGSLTNVAYSWPLRSPATTSSSRALRALPPPPDPGVRQQGDHHLGTLCGGM